ncbi:FUSC family protein [Streptomyces sp. NPDC058321]|uniref:FUSC family protein n=1 Tax=Streptomyces sp. NPDC058321 TaxID=3346445 RepID=UPI0036EAE2EA
MLSATVVLHAGGDRASNTVRGVHRIAGSLLGIGVAAGIKATHPTSAAQLLLVIGGAWGTNLLLRKCRYRSRASCPPQPQVRTQCPSGHPRPSRAVGRQRVQFAARDRLAPGSKFPSGAGQQRLMCG